MVHKIKFIILFIISFALCTLCFLNKGNIETNILNTLLPQSIINSTDIVPVLNKSSSVIKVVFESKDEEELEKIKNDFISQIDTDYFEYNKPDVSRLLDKYLSHPNNFLSTKTKKLLKENRFDEIYQTSINMLYNPTGIQLSALDQDPFLLLDDFILNNKKITNNKNNFDDKYYDTMQLKIKTQEGLSPDLANKKIKEIINIQKKLSDKSFKIYLAGTPIHSYYTSIKSVISINVICILSTILIIILTFYYFGSLRALLPVIISISFGMLTGFCATKLWFSDFQIITMVFSATLIGIGIDYSYHYFFKGDENKIFNKNLSLSFLTSAIPFILLYLTKIELLKQVAIFTIFGLLGIYLTVLFIYPCFNLKKPQKTIKLNPELYKIYLISLIILSIAGLFRFHFNDTITALYTPSGTLKKAETLYSQISDDNFQNTQIIVVKDKNYLKEEEKISDMLINNDIDYMAISKFIPSLKTQKENFELIKKLYKNKLDKYSDILSSKQINKLKNSKFDAVNFNIDDYPYLKDFILNDNASLIFALTDKKINLQSENAQIINFKSDIQTYMTKYRNLVSIFFPVTLLILFCFLSVLYGIKKGIKILLPSLTGIIAALLINCLIAGELNLFSIISIYLVLGFTMDYSIFRANKENKTEDAIFVSCITTSCSFLLLCFCGFKLLSSISLILFFGIITSYLTGYLLFLKSEK